MRMSSCRSSVTSCRSVETSTAMSGYLRFGAFLLFRARGQLVARAPQRREEVVVDHLPEHFDRRALRADDLIADDARNDLVVADAPHRHPLVPLDQRLGELVELLVLTSLHVHLDRVEACGRNRLLEGLAERRRDAAHLAKAGRVEAAAVTEHSADRLVFP